MDAELQRLTDIVLRAVEEIDGKNQQLEHMEIMLEEGSARLEDMERQLEESSMSLTRMTEERDQLNLEKKAYKKKNRKLKKAMSENERLMRQLEDEKKQIEQLAIKKRDSELDFPLDFQDKQLVLVAELDTVQGNCEGVNNMSTGDEVEGQVDTNGIHIKLEEEDFELDNVLNLKQTLANKEHRSNHDLQETRKVSSEEVEKGDDVVELGEWCMGDMDDDEDVECNAFLGMLPPILSLDTDLSDKNKKDNSSRSCTLNPVAVLENSSSCSDDIAMALSPETLVPRGVLSKRKRSAESEFFAESNPSYTPNFGGDELKKKKMKGVAPSVPSCSADHENLLQQQQQKPIVGYQKCVHCGVTATSEWRDGPMGPGTLCNVCEISLIVLAALG